MILKDKILHFSREKFLSNGISNVTMDDIAKEMRISKKTIYKFFPAKQDLVHESVFGMLDSVKKSFVEVTDGQQNSIEKLSAIGKIFFALAKKFSENWLNDLKINNYNLWIQVDEFRTKAIGENFSKIIEQGKQEGYFLDKPTPIILVIFISSIRAVINPEFLMNNSFSAETAAKITLDHLFTGLLTKQGRKVYKQLKMELEP
ncbi:MAG: hypothetical protein CVV23_07690 [Ignavibacteriae bacterium HGW-Ignavibacteriae-2]|jgi:AcrR family transcriptional regulator|nr:MAG: hypothetical protein CVV23_07690 [Ignavibacteriae bacterium HGW-Ignavibacteriae-2]